METWGISTNIQHSAFALKLRRYRQMNGLTTDEAGKSLGISEERVALLELDRSTPTVFEKWRLNRLIAKQKTAPLK